MDTPLFSYWLLVIGYEENQSAKRVGEKQITNNR